MKESEWMELSFDIEDQNFVRNAMIETDLV